MRSRQRGWIATVARWAGLILTAALLLAPVAGALWFGLVEWPEPVKPGNENALAAENSSKRTATLAMVAGLIALGGLAVSVASHRRQAKHDVVTTDKGRQDLIHQRYSTAIDHLASRSPAIQAAAIYALEDVVKADPERRVAIVQTLVALVRDLRTELAGGSGADTPVPDVRLVAGQVVIARQKLGLGAPPAWLPGADLRAFSLVDADLVQADLAGVDMIEASLSGSLLIDANIDGASLLYADFSGSKLTDASLRDVSAAGADFSGAHVFNADLSNADLTECKFVGTDLQWAKLVRANLMGADLSDAALIGADLSGANLSGANLSGANLGGADLSGADLELASYDDQVNWLGVNVWGVKGIPDGWYPPGALRKPPDEQDEDEQSAGAAVRGD